MDKRRYGPYANEFGHEFWVDVYPDGSRKSVWVHREMMEQYLGRTLGADEVVHHKNENPADNWLENFEVKDRAVHAHDHARPPEMIPAECPQCHVDVQLRASRVRHNQNSQGKAGPFCSRSCAGKWSRQQQIAAGFVNLRRVAQLEAGNRPKNDNGASSNLATPTKANGEST